jgi:hypothetical protein
MGRIVGGMATSHAFAFMEPAAWDEFRARNRQSLLRRTGIAPPPHPRIEAESPDEVEVRYQRIRLAHGTLRNTIAAQRPDALIVIGDDQHENFVATIPQIAVHMGGAFDLAGHFVKGKRHYTGHEPIARALLGQGVSDGFDITSVNTFEGSALKSHAHVQVLQELAVPEDIPIVLVFVNAITRPSIEPRRCFALGQSIARAIAARPEGERVLICASGGLSHFTAGFPWTARRSPESYGQICEAFDRRVIALIEQGRGSELAQLTSEELLEHGNIELRSWIALLGAIGPIPSEIAVYEPFYRAVTGMGVAAWSEAARKYEERGA